MKSYLFSCGNSSAGPVGFCVRIKAETEEGALAKLREAMPDSEEISNRAYRPDSGIEYLNVYFNADAITLDDIEDEEDVDEDDEA